jgi:hypothetical protein
VTVFKKIQGFFSEKASWADLVSGKWTLWGQGEILDHAHAAINHSLNPDWLDPTLSEVYAIAYNRLRAFSNLPTVHFSDGISPWIASISKWYAVH